MLGTELRHSKYRILGLVGQGQFGRVFCAVHRQTGKLVALKSLERERFPTHKFLRELRILLSLQHPNIVTCQALEQTTTGRCLVMDYCEGGTLRSLMLEDARLSLPQSLKLVADILEGLVHAHKREVVHCDIKPENILLNVTATGWTARISDFGIARISQELNNQDSGNTGSPAYMAPERFYGQYSLTSDLYSVGILLFELLAGYRPFSGTPTELMSAHLNQPVKIPEAIPEIWHPFLVTALQKLSARRFRSANEMLSALRSIANAEGSGSWLDRSIHLPLLQPAPSLSISPVRPQHTERLTRPMTALAAMQSVSKASLPPTNRSNGEALSPIYLYRVDKQSVIVQPFERFRENSEAVPSSQGSLRSSSPKEAHRSSYGTAIETIFPRPQGCFVVTQRSLHLIPQPAEPPPDEISPPILEFEQGSLVAIEPSGRWMALLTMDAEAKIGTLTFHPLPGVSSRLSLTPFPIQIPLKRYHASSLQLLPLNRSHVAIVAEALTNGQGRSFPSAAQAKDSDTPGKFVKVLTRRGQVVGALDLPVNAGQLALTANPYRLMTVDRQNPKTVLLVDLKPYRILRIGVDIQPTHLIATSWGYILANPEGAIVALDREGRQSGQLQTDLPITAIAFGAPHTLFVATWQEPQGNLHAIDLQKADLELLF